MKSEEQTYFLGFVSHQLVVKTWKTCLSFPLLQLTLNILKLSKFFVDKLGHI